MSVTPQQMQALTRLGGVFTSPGSTAGQTLGELGSGLGVASGLQSGTTTGDISAAANAARLANQSGLLRSLGVSPSTMSGVNTGATGALDALAMYQGLRAGGIQGYGSALGAGLQGAGTMLGNTALSTAGGAVLAPLSVYNAVKNWQSGNTGSDALQGAEAGAAIGSIVPGVGTIIGGLVGGGIGALSSAFGGGRPDLETGGWNQFAKAYNQATPQQQAAVMPTLNPAQAYQNLAGVMDAKNNTPGHSQSIEQVFGRMGEQNLMDQMTNYINQQVAAGKITPGESVANQWTQTVDPWLQSKGVTWNPNQRTSTGQLETPALQGDIQSLIGSWESGALTPQSKVGIGGQTIGGLGTFAGPQAAAPQTQTAPPPQISQAAPPAVAQPQQGSPYSFMGMNMPNVSIPANTNAVSYGGMYMPNVPYGRAEGGLMKKSKRNAIVDQVLKAPPFYKRQNFQSGGSAYDAYPNYAEYFGNPASAQSTDPFTSPTTPTGAATPSQYSQSGATTASTGSSKLDQELSNAWKNMSGQSGISGVLKAITAISPLAALLIKPKTNTNPPTPAPGMTQGAQNPKAPIYSRSQVTSGTGGVTPQLGATGSPSNLPGGKPMTLADWYTYGSRPEANFFQNNQVPLSQMTGVATGQAKGGRQSGLDSLGGGPEFDSAFQSHAEGPGDGTSDNIPAQLSDGEYVMDANTVSLLGNGSNKAGAARLDQLRENIRKHAAGSMSKGKQFMKAKPPEAYLGLKGGRKK